MNILPEHIEFASREEFREWLTAHALSSEGVWLLFGKPGGPKTLRAAEALEEALCFGWIDGQIRSLDSTSYVKYFSRRRAKSKWSDKNKGIAEKLQAQGVMTEQGRAKIEEAKNSGQWDKQKAPPITDEQIAALAEALRRHEQACANFMAMSPSVKKTYTRAYLDPKTDAGRASRFLWIIERLNKNLKPM